MSKTKLNRKQIAEILSKYSLGRLLEYSYFKRGVVHTNILLKTTQGKYVLRMYEKKYLLKMYGTGRTRKFIDFELALLKRLRQHHFPTPAVIASNHGNELITYKNRPVVIFDYIRGVHVQNPTEKHLIQVGRTLAAMHRITQEFKPKYSKLRWNANVKNIRKLAAQLIAKGRKKKIRNIPLIETTINEEFKLFTFPKSLPQGALHADLFKDNVKFCNGKLSGILDFDDSFCGFLLDDISTALLGWCFPHDKFNARLARILLRNYQQVRPLTKEEKAYLYFSLKFISLKFGIYVMNRMEKEGDASNFFFQRYFSLVKTSKKEFDERMLQRC